MEMEGGGGDEGESLLLTLGVHARGLQYLFCLRVCVCFP